MVSIPATQKQRHSQHVHIGPCDISVRVVGLLMMLVHACCLGCTNQHSSSEKKEPPPIAPTTKPSGSLGESSSVSTSFPPPPIPTPTTGTAWMPCPTLRLARPELSPLLPRWLPDEFKPRLSDPFPPVPLLLNGTPSIIEIVRNERGRAVGIAINRWVDDALTRSKYILLPSSAQSALSGFYRDADASVNGASDIGVAILAESVVVVVITDAMRLRVRKSLRLQLPARGGERPGRPRISYGGGLYGVVVPLGSELFWFEVDSSGSILRGPILLNAHAVQPRLVWNGDRFVVLGSPPGEGDHTLALYEIAPRGMEPSQWHVLARSYNPTNPFNQRRYFVCGDLLFEGDSYFLLVSSWAASHRDPDKRFEMYRIGRDGSVESQRCPISDE